GEAAAARAGDLAAPSGGEAPELPALTRLVETVLLADLAEAVPDVVSALESRAALTSDVAHLMAALPPLASTLRYGNVRGTDAAAVRHVVAGLVARICIGLPGACSSLDDDAATAMARQVGEVHSAIRLLGREEHAAAWTAVLRRLADLPGSPQQQGTGRADSPQHWGAGGAL